MLKSKPNAKNGKWELYLLGNITDTERKALIVNIENNQIFEAKVLLNKQSRSITVLEMIDTKLNIKVSLKNNVFQQER